MKDAGILPGKTGNLNFSEVSKVGKLENFLKAFPISSLKNIVPVRESVDDAIEDLKKCTIANLTKAYNKETNVHLKSNIARALRKLDYENCFNFSLFSLQGPVVCKKERNEMWMDIIGQWKNNNMNTDIDSLCNTMRAMLKRQISQKSRVSIFLKEFFRPRV